MPSKPEIVKSKQQDPNEDEDTEEQPLASPPTAPEPDEDELKPEKPPDDPKEPTQGVAKRELGRVTDAKPGPASGQGVALRASVPTPDAKQRERLGVPAVPAEQAKPVFKRELRVTNENRDSFVWTEEVPTSVGVNQRGLCLKCGWQSLQSTAEGARSAVLAHLGRHYREAA